jgi:hypothetical protein
MVTLIFSNGTSVTLDAALSEKHALKVTLTKHPVEAGVAPSDHATLQPQTFGVEGMFTNLPLSQTQQQARAGGRFVSQMVDLLFATVAAREAITVQTELRKYTNMIMTSLSMPRTPDVGEAVQFSAEFEEVRFVQTQTVTLAPKQTSVPQKPTQKNRQGVQASFQPPPEQEVSMAKAVSNSSGRTAAGSGVRGP